MRVELGIRIATPLSIGWYEPSKIDRFWIVRPTSVKGLWRWWARAFVAGAMYEAGMLRGESAKNVVLKPRKDEVERISRVVSFDMGLGGVVDKAEQSRFRILINVDEVKHPPRIETVRRGSKGFIRPYGRLQRFSLLTITGDVEVVREAELRLVVELLRSRNKRLEELALKILLVALTLSGVGKGGRKALGCLDIVYIHGMNVPRDLSKLISEIHDDLLNYVSRTFRSATRSRSIPPLPCLASTCLGREEGIELFASQIYRIEDVEFAELHNFFVRTTRCLKILRNPAGFDDLRKTYNAWVLGLPRYQAKMRTGYDIRSPEIDRRASTIIVSWHGRDHLFGRGGYVSVLVSGDWPKDLVWENSGRQTISIDPARILKAHAIALKELNTYLDGKLFHSRVWP